MAGARRIRFTKHAVEELDMLKRYGFEIKRRHVVETILYPESLGEKDD